MLPSSVFFFENLYHMMLKNMIIQEPMMAEHKKPLIHHDGIDKDYSKLLHTSGNEERNKDSAGEEWILI